MEELILIIRDDTRITPYESILSFMKFEIVDETDYLKLDFKIYAMVIIDVESPKKGILIGNIIRGSDPHMSLLLIHDFGHPSEHFSFTKIKGYGQSRVLRYRAAYPDVLIEYVQSMLHPEYPSKRNDVAIILPVYNEEERIASVIDFIKSLQVLINESFINANIYFVNDGSKDNTKDMIEKISKDEYEQSTLVSNKYPIYSYNLNINTRKAGTYLEGIRNIDASILIFADADNSFSIEDIAKIINILNVGYYDIVAGTKDETAENRPLIRRIMSFSKRLLTKGMLPKGVYDSQTGLKGMSWYAAKTILPYLHEDTGLAIDLEIMHIAKKLNLRVLQLPVKCIDREGSHVRLVADSISFVKNIAKLRLVNKNIDINADEFE